MYASVAFEGVYLCVRIYVKFGVCSMCSFFAYNFYNFFVCLWEAYSLFLSLVAFEVLCVCVRARI